MTWGLVATGAGVLIGGIIQGKAARDAAGAQTDAANAGISEERRQFDALTKLMEPWIKQGETALGWLQPYAEAGAPALAQQQALLGLSGPEAQQQALQAIERGGLFQDLVGQGESAILQNASATGGLRGGNTQAAMAQFRPQMLNQAINEQYGRLGGLTALGQQTNLNIAQLGQASAARQAAAGQQSAANIAGLYGNIGQAQAGNSLAQGQIWSNAIGNLTGIFAGGFGARSVSPQATPQATPQTVGAQSHIPAGGF